MPCTLSIKNKKGKSNIDSISTLQNPIALHSDAGKVSKIKSNLNIITNSQKLFIKLKCIRFEKDKTL